MIASFWSLVDLLQRYNGAVTAVATVLIGIFTLVLALVTGRQARLTRETIEVARQEFISSHRPKIIVHSVEITHNSVPMRNEPTVGASVVYFNVGDTPARIIEINAKISMRPLPLQSGLGVGIGVRLAGLPVPKELVESGHPNFVAVFSDQTLEQVRFAEKSSDGRDRDGGLVCIGMIAYEDGRRARHETGFCRRLETTTERWVQMDHHEYEYSY